MIDIRVKNGESGYDLVTEYIRRYWEIQDSYDDVIVQLNTSFDGVNWDMGMIEFAPFDYDNNSVYWFNDWWEGEEYIQIVSIVNKCDLELPENTDWMEE